MANLYLTHKCNRGCSFCFARKVFQEGAGDIEEILTVDEIEQLLSHFPNQFTEIGILGGEPFLYPHLGEALELLWQQNITPKIFTSATDPLPVALDNALAMKKPMGFVVNMGEKESYSADKYGNLLDFFAKFHHHISLSYTIFDLNTDPTFLFEAIDAFQLTRNIRVGVALPIYQGGNQYVPKEKYRDLGQHFVRFAREAAERNVVLGMDCGFVACMFTPGEIGTLQRCGVRLSFCCGVAMDIGPGLKAWNCFPLFQLHRENVLASKRIENLVDKFNHTIHQHFNNKDGIFEACKDCKHFKRKVCEGGCKSFNSVNYA